MHAPGFIGWMLAVAVDGDRHVVAARARFLEAGAERRAFAAVVCVHQHVAAGRPRDLGGAVGRAVVDHDHIAREVGAKLCDHLADDGRHLISGNQRRSAHGPT